MTLQQKLTFKGLAEKILSKTDTPLTYGEIWEEAEKEGLTQLLNSEGKTPKQTLSAILSVEAKKPGGNIGAVSGEPGFGIRYYLKDHLAPAQATLKASEAQDQMAAQVDVETAAGFREKDLHPHLAYFMWRRYSAVCKTINHSLSVKSKAARNKWLHPDVMSITIPFETFDSGVAKLARGLGCSIAQVYSIELKLTLTPWNIHEYFFQAVSNSTWANEAYLAAKTISDDEDFRRELSGLSKSFGVGVIHLDTEDPDSSEIIFPARPKEVVDWGRLNRIANVNSDVQAFIDKASKILSEKFDEKTLSAWFDEVPEKHKLPKLGAKNE